MALGTKRKFGQRFKEAREYLGLTQQEVATKLKVSGAVVSDWEKGKSSPQMERLDSIATALQKPISYFFADPEDIRGHRTDRPGDFVRAYSQAIQRLSELEWDHMAQANSFALLRRHFEVEALVMASRLEEEDMASALRELYPHLVEMKRVVDSKGLDEQFQRDHAGYAFSTLYRFGLTPTRDVAPNWREPAFDRIFALFQKVHWDMDEDWKEALPHLEGWAHEQGYELDLDEDEAEMAQVFVRYARGLERGIAQRLDHRRKESY